MPDVIQERINKKLKELRVAGNRITVVPGYVKLPYLLGIDTEPVLVAEYSHKDGAEHVVVVSPEAIYLVSLETFLSATIKYALVTVEEARRAGSDNRPMGFMPDGGPRELTAAGS